MTLTQFLYWYILTGGIMAGYFTAVIYYNDEPSWFLFFAQQVTLLILAIIWLPLVVLFICYFIYHLIRSLWASRKRTETSNP